MQSSSLKAAYNQGLKINDEMTTEFDEPIPIYQTFTCHPRILLPLLNIYISYTCSNNGVKWIMLSSDLRRVWNESLGLTVI